MQTGPWPRAPRELLNGEKEVDFEHKRKVHICDGIDTGNMQYATKGQTSTRVSNLEKSREILTSLAPSRSKKLNFHSLSLLDFQDFEEKILFLFSIYENLKHKSRSLLDLDLEFSSGSVCVWN